VFKQPHKILLFICGIYTKPASVGGDSKIVSQNAVHTVSSWAGVVVCTTLFSATFPLNANWASVVELGSYLGQAGVGDTNGFLAKDATIVWRVLDSCTSDAVAVVLLNVPKISGTKSYHTVNIGPNMVQ
jgi:hypothetical protein